MKREKRQPTKRGLGTLTSKRPVMRRVMRPAGKKTTTEEV